MKKAPSLKVLEQQILNEKQVADSLSFLFKDKSLFERFESVEESAYFGSDDEDNKLKAFEYYFLNISTAIYRVFHKHNIFLSSQALQDILFFVLKSSSQASVIREVLGRIRNSGLDKHSVVIFPLHSFGILGLGWVDALRDVKASYFIAPDADFVLVPQTNSFERTRESIVAALESLNFKFRGKFPDEDLAHFRRSRPTKWLEKNPLLICKLRFSKVVPYENQTVIARNIEKFVTLSYFVSVLQKYEDLPSNKEWGFGSTKTTNNRETLDLHHYLTLAHKPYERSIEMSCTPLNVDRTSLMELMGLNVELFPILRDDEKEKINKINNQLRRLYMTLEQSRWQKESAITSSERFDLKSVDSLAFFRRSFRATTMDERIVNLATAFEALLLDSYEARNGSIENVFKKRVEGAFKLTKTKDHHRAGLAAQLLYATRCKVVHSGKRVKKFENFEFAQYAFIRVFELLHSRVSQIDFSKQHPVRDFFKREGIDT